VHIESGSQPPTQQSSMSPLSTRLLTLEYRKRMDSTFRRAVETAANATKKDPPWWCVRNIFASVRDDCRKENGAKYINIIRERRYAYVPIFESSNACVASSSISTQRIQTLVKATALCRNSSRSCGEGLGSLDRFSHFSTTVVVFSPWRWSLWEKKRLRQRIQW
jgi:hypothetical protein